jgi:protease IV
MTFIGTLKNLLCIVLFVALLPLLPMVSNGVKRFIHRYIDPRASVGVVSFKGILYDSSSYVQCLQKYFKDDEIKAILLKIECPGSATGTGQALFNEITTLKRHYPKPVIVLTENLCASGGYYIACAADHIIASSLCLVGSIGVTIPYFFELKDFVEQFKIKPVILSAGAYKDSTNPFTHLTPVQKQMLQGTIDDAYEHFAADVAKSRNLSMDNLSQWADGKIFTGAQAKKLGLVDELGSYSDAVSAIKERAHIDTEINWITPPSKNSILSWFSQGNDDCGEQSVFSACVHEACSIVENRYANRLH